MDDSTFRSRNRERRLPGRVWTGVVEDDRPMAHTHAPQTGLTGFRLAHSWRKDLDRRGSPTVTEIRCEVPHDQHVSTPSDYFRGDMTLGEIRSYRCESGYRQTAAEATCTRDGWTPDPLCAEAACLLQWNRTVGDLRIEGLPVIEGPVKPGHKLTFSCTGEGMKLNGERDITCLSNGEWSSPFPKCQEIACEGQQLFNVEILFGHPGIDSPYKPGHVLLFRCSDVNQKLDGRRAIECQSDGKWDYPYPTCREITCEVPHDQHVYRPSDFFRGDMKLGTKKSYRCESRYRKTAEKATCTRDGWTPDPLCAGTGKCGPPPPVNDGDTTDITKKEYNTGERVEYICFSKYKLDTRPTFSRYLTCVQGEWSGNVKCLKPCTVTMEIMNERGIELAYRDEQKMFAPHDDHLTFRCQWGKRLTERVDFRQKCNDGVMTLPECV